MKRSNRLILLIGVFLAIVAFVGIVLIFQGRGTQSGPAAVNPETPTVFAARDIPLGTPIREEMLTTENLAVTSRDVTAFADESLVVGKTARKPIAQGKQLTADDFETASAANIDFTLAEGQKAMSVEIDMTNGVAKLIQAGDYVDIVASFAFDVTTFDPDTGTPSEVPGLDSPSSKMIIQGMQVLGVVDTGAVAAPPAEGEVGAGPTVAPAHVVLSVSAQQAELIKFIQSTTLLEGTSVRWPISLVMRAPCVDDQGNATVCPLDPTTGVTVRTLVDEYDVLVPQLVEAVLPNRPTP